MTIRSLMTGVLAGVCLAGADAFGAEPLCVFPLDGTGEAVVRAGAAPAKGVVYGRETWVKGVSGQGLDVRRHAYDQATCFIVDPVKDVSAKEGTVAFWFKPHWAENEPGSHTIVSAREKGWKPFRFYLVKGERGSVELSVVAPRQVQLFKKGIFKKDVWTHVAFTWCAATGEVVLYADGKPVARRPNKDAFGYPEPRATMILACGDGSSDRFKAKTGDGVYDDIRLYDAALSETEIFQLVTEGSSGTLKPVAAPGAEFAFTFRTNRLTSAQNLIRLEQADAADRTRLTLTAMGASGRLGLVLEADGKTQTLESADTFNLRVPTPVAFACADGALVWKIAGAEQGRLPFKGAFAGFTQAACAEGVRFIPAEKVARLPFLSRRDALAPVRGEDALWDLSDAQRRADGARRGVTLNGYWRVQPVDDFTLAPSSGDWLYVRVPGSFRSPLWGYHTLEGEDFREDHARLSEPDERVLSCGVVPARIRDAEDGGGSARLAQLREPERRHGARLPEREADLFLPPRREDPSVRAERPPPGHHGQPDERRWHECPVRLC